MNKRIGLIDVDGHNFPNIPLMKISAWHKANGDHVEAKEGRASRKAIYCKSFKDG